mmetsp:Transcript_52312/g.147271  ORF Transcript_52312/g.147271 Transcript_52312/m.147271 type:complete len:253 (-) Transcript_52312:1366-2124(-)
MPLPPPADVLAPGRGVEMPPPGAMGRSTTTLLIISPLRIRTAVFAFPIVRPHRGHVCTRREPRLFVEDSFVPSSTMARLTSSRTTQLLISPSCSRSHMVTSRARRSAKARRRSGPLSGSRAVVVTDCQGRTRFFSKTSASALQKASLRRHSEERTTMAPVRSTMWRRAFTAEGKKSVVSTRTAASLPSSERMSKPPARAGRSTPSTSRKRTLLRSAGGMLERWFALSRTSASFCRVSLVMASSSGFGWGMSA